MTKMKPLTKKDIIRCMPSKDGDIGIEPIVELNDVLSALALAKKKIADYLCTPFGNGMSLEEETKLFKILDECFHPDINRGQIEQDAKGKSEEPLRPSGSKRKSKPTACKDNPSEEASSQVPARCSRLECHNFPDITTNTKCKWCGKTVNEILTMGEKEWKIKDIQGQEKGSGNGSIPQGVTGDNPGRKIARKPKAVMTSSPDALFARECRKHMKKVMRK